MSLDIASVMTGRRYVSRGGDKLDGAIESRGIDVLGMRALDAGASTGGFTDCLLTRGARAVIAVDVAYGQFDWRLRNDPRVTLLERTNVRAITVDEPVDLVVADLSFISLRTVAGSLVNATHPSGQLLLMVKPQFELPRDRVERGVVRDPQGWIEAMHAVAASYREHGCGLAGAVPSLLTGPKGNREFFLHLVRGGPDAGDEVITRAAAEAP